MIVTESRTVVVFATPECEFSPDFKISERMETLDDSTCDETYEEMSKLNLTNGHENDLAEYTTSKMVESISDDDSDLSESDSDFSDYEELDFYEIVDADYRSTPSSSPEKPTPTRSTAVGQPGDVYGTVKDGSEESVDDFRVTGQLLSQVTEKPTLTYGIGEAQYEDISDAEKETYDNVDVPSFSVHRSTLMVLQETGADAQNEDSCETVKYGAEHDDRMSESSSSPANLEQTQTQVNGEDRNDKASDEIKGHTSTSNVIPAAIPVRKKFRQVRCSAAKPESRRTSDDKSVDIKCSNLETQSSEDEDTTTCETLNPIIIPDSIVSNADFEVKLPQNSYVLKTSAIHANKEPTKRQFSETDSDESDTSGSDSKKFCIIPSEQRDDTDEFKCQECSEVFSDRFRLFKHSSTHKTDNHFRCDECDESFAYTIMLYNHKLNRHSPENKHVCYICKKVYKRQSYLELHMNLHMKQKFSCSICNKDFSSLRKLKNHLRKEHPEKRNADKSVNLKPVGESDTNIDRAKPVYDNDMDESSNTGKTDTTETNKTYECKLDVKGDILCKSDTCRSTSFSDAVRRISFKDTSRRAAISKSICTRKQSTSTELKFKPKMKVTEHKCEHCGLVLKRKLQLNQHMLKEHNISHFECTECNLKFASLTYLKNHNKDRHSNESAPCPICSKVFKCIRYLKEHIRFTHEKLRNFVCKICGAKYSRSKPLKLHELKHHPNGEKSETSIDETQGHDNKPKHEQAPEEVERTAIIC